jgi:hypothetical protein
MNNRNALWKTFFGNAECVRNYYIYSYEYMDDLSFMPSAHDAFTGWEEGEALIARVEEKFKDMGCQGDGEMQVMWLPPFVGAAEENNYGCYVLHYKQSKTEFPGWHPHLYCRSSGSFVLMAGNATSRVHATGLKRKSRRKACHPIGPANSASSETDGKSA